MTPGNLNSECILVNKSLLKYEIYLGKRKMKKYGHCKEKKMNIIPK